MVDVVAHVHCHLGIYTSADMTSNRPLFNTHCLIHSQKKELSENFLSKRILELKCCLGSGIFTAAVKRVTRKQRVPAAISKLRSAFITGYKNKICTYYRRVLSESATLYVGLSGIVRNLIQKSTV